MGCTNTVPSDHITKRQISTNTVPSDHITKRQISTETIYKTDYERILCSPGQLETTLSHQPWFPSGHAHTNIRDLFQYHNEFARGTTSTIHDIEYNAQPCALKQIPTYNECARMIFETEARILSNLRHKGIIAFVDMFCDEKYYYLVLQKADFDLQDVLKKKSHLPEKKTRNIIYSLLQTIQYLHRKHVVHRDIKPENITFIASDTDNPLLVDFGDAEIVKSDQIYIELVGTPPYMAPERLEEHQGWKLKKSDIWAIGVVAYEMYCGQRCFVGNTQKEVFGRILSGNWSWPNELNVSDHFKDFIEQCLALDAKHRPSATEALDHPWFQRIQKETEMD